LKKKIKEAKERGGENGIKTRAPDRPSQKTGLGTKKKTNTQMGSETGYA